MNFITLKVNVSRSLISPVYINTFAFLLPASTLPILKSLHHVYHGQKKSPFRGFRFNAGDFLLHRQHVYPFARTVEPVEVHHAIGQRKQSKVPAHAHVSARVNAGAELAYNDITGTHGLTAKHFDTASLPLAIAPVTGTPTSFFVRHIVLLSRSSNHRFR
jgi:hypothetical protein